MTNSESAFMNSAFIKKHISLFSKIAILTATLIWGSSFFILKNVIDELPKWYVLGTRFFFGTVILGIAFHKKLHKLNRKIIIHGVVLGIILFLAYAFQTWGLQNTTPGRNAFFTAVYVVMVPFVFWITDREKPTFSVIMAALICICGIFLLSWEGGFSSNSGDVLSLIGGFFYALQIVYTFKYAREDDPITITFFQFATCAVLFFTLALLTEEFPQTIAANQIIPLLYLGIFCTTVALILQNMAQKHIPTTTASLLLSLEAVFGVLFSILFYGETLSFRSGIGFLLIFAAEVASQTNILNPGKKQTEREIQNKTNEPIK